MAIDYNKTLSFSNFWEPVQNLWVHVSIAPCTSLSEEFTTQVFYRDCMANVLLDQTLLGAISYIPFIYEILDVMS